MKNRLIAAILSLSTFVACSAFNAANDDDDASLLLLAAAAALSQQIDTTKFTYITTSTQNGSALGGVTGADAICNTASNLSAAGLSGTGTYKALIVDGANRIACVNANCSPTNAADGTGWVLQAGTQYFRQDQTTLITTTDSNRLFTFPLTNSLGVNPIWTGLETNWTTHADTCASWTGGTNGRAGDPTQTSINAVSSGVSFGCGTPRLLLCIQQ